MRNRKITMRVCVGLTGAAIALAGCVNADDPPSDDPSQVPDEATLDQGDRAWIDAEGVSHVVHKLTHDELVEQGLEAMVTPEAEGQSSSPPQGSDPGEPQEAPPASTTSPPP